MYQAAAAGAWQTTPLVVDGVMYLTQRPNDVVALDAKTGRVFWIYRHTLDRRRSSACGANNRGLRSSATRSSWARSMPISWRSTRRRDVPCGIQSRRQQGRHSVTHAPLIVKDKVIVASAAASTASEASSPRTTRGAALEAWRFLYDSRSE